MSSKNLLIVSVLALLLLPSFAFAVPGLPIVQCGTSTTANCTRCDLFKLLKNLIDFTTYVLMPAVAILLFVWAGFLILLGGANTNLVAQGRQIFSTTFYGIIIMLSAWMITNTLIKSIGSNYDKADTWWQFTCVETAPVSPPTFKYSCNQNNQCAIDPSGTYTTPNCDNKCQPIPGGLTITTNSLPNAYIGLSYSQTISASGGQAPYSWVFSGSLPPGLSVTTGGLIVGTPLKTGLFNFTVRVTDSSNPIKTTTTNFSISVNTPGALAIETSKLSDADRGQPYSAQISATGGVQPYTWSLGQGSSLPSGLNLDLSSGVVSGTPTNSGTFNFTVAVKDSSSPQLTATRPLTLTIKGLSVPPGTGALSITTSSLPDGTINQNYSSQVVASGGTPSYSWSISGGALPPGTNINSATGVISGTPTTAGTFNFTVRVQDSSPVRLTATRPLSIVVTSGSTLVCGQPWEQNLCQPRQMTCGASTCGQYVSAINQYAGRTRVSNGANFLKAIMIKESACNVRAQSDSVPPSCGLMQLKASTANIYKNKCGVITDITCDWLKDPSNATASICIAAEYMGALTQTSCGGTPRGVAAGYNGGSGACNNSIDCAGETSCAGGPVQRWECLYDNPQQTVCNTGYAETRDYATKVLYCYNNPGF